jgi:methylated-DNA-[protein]-cysteine S-methyltransferase
LVKEIPNQRLYTSFKTDSGWVAMLVSPSGIARLTPAYSSEKEALEILGLKPEDTRANFERFDEAVCRIRDYYRGKSVAFSDKLDLSSGSEFQQRVWNSCRTIPYGETRSYAWIARQIGKPGAARAVGNALGKNPVTVIIPCHRVIASDGSIGGFTGGLPAKRRLLKIEGTKITGSPRR